MFFRSRVVGPIKAELCARHFDFLEDRRANAQFAFVPTRQVDYDRNRHFVSKGKLSNILEMASQRIQKLGDGRIEFLSETVRSQTPIPKSGGRWMNIRVPTIKGLTWCSA